MAGKKSAYEMMMEKARAGAKGKGRPPASSSAAKAKEAVKEEVKDSSVKDTVVDVKMEEAVVEKKPKAALTVADKLCLLTKKETEFDPTAAAFWKPGEHVPFTFLASAFDSTCICSVQFFQVSVCLCVMRAADDFFIDWVLGGCEITYTSWWLSAVEPGELCTINNAGVHNYAVWNSHLV